MLGLIAVWVINAVLYLAALAIAALGFLLGAPADSGTQRRSES